MKWNEESFAPWTIKSFHAPLNYLCGPEKRRGPGLRPLLLPSRGEYLECFVRCVDPKEIDFRSRNVRGNAGNRNRNGPGTLPPPFPIVPTLSPLFLPMKEHWRLIQTDFNETFHNFVSWVNL